MVFLIDTQAGRLRLIPAETHDVEGGPFPDSWEYRLTLGGPSRTLTYDWIPASSVLHFRYAVDASTPWRGNGPVQVAALAGRLSAETVRALAEESSGPVGRLLGIPVDGDDATVQGLKADIKNAAGRVALLETGDWGNVGGDTKVDLQTQRFGAEPPASLVELVDVSSREIYAAQIEPLDQMRDFLEAVFAVKLQTTSTNRLGKPGVLTTMARLSQWALENGYLDSERGKDSSKG